MVLDCLSFCFRQKVSLSFLSCRIACNICIVCADGSVFSFRHSTHKILLLIRLFFSFSISFSLSLSFSVSFTIQVFFSSSFFFFLKSCACVCVFSPLCRRHRFFSSLFECLFHATLFFRPKLDSLDSLLSICFFYFIFHAYMSVWFLCRFHVPPAVQYLWRNVSIM